MGQGKYKRNRPDKDGHFRAAFDKNKKIIYATQTVCAICGRPVDFSLKFPDPMSPTIDHIIPIAKGGHPSDLGNMQLAHLSCNRAKADKVVNKKYIPDQSLGNRVLPQSRDWASYRSNQK
ncbi:HNH endonuclease signature motif containing protein [Galactobacillus timonensis]|uniref:HNH endonuclease n=1 Tax=Galactobacillus timonensis TaxID=2041840 RepID=UPI002409A16D|nr:HNH endonuclease signature motif containing protein [Galactobacillus timonensis]MDD6369161.1 HNH endonuclease signature motif containing protein [Galactobacillus timonensis]